MIFRKTARTPLRDVYILVTFGWLSRGSILRASAHQRAQLSLKLTAVGRYGAMLISIRLVGLRLEDEAPERLAEIEGLVLRAPAGQHLDELQDVFAELARVSA